MRDYLEFETTPCNEQCEPLGPQYDQAKARFEACVFIRQLERQFPRPDSCAYRIASNAHDFGCYYSIKLSYDCDDEVSADYAFNVDENAPQDWDVIARKELAQYSNDNAKTVSEADTYNRSNQI